MSSPLLFSLTALFGVALLLVTLVLRNLVRENAGLKRDLATLRPESEVQPTTPALDLSGARKMTGGNKKLFHKILRDFLEKYRDLPSECVTLLELGKWEELERKAHTVKGNAGMLGLSELSAAAAQLEASANEQARAVSRHAIQVLQVALTPALRAIQKTVEQAAKEAERAEPVSPSPQENAEPMEEMLAKALDLLDRGEYGAHAILAKIQSQYSVSTYVIEFVQICDDVDSGNYDEACENLRLLMGSGKIQ